MSTEMRPMTVRCRECRRPFRIVMTFGDHPPKTCARCRYFAARAMIGQIALTDRTPDDG